MDQTNYPGPPTLFHIRINSLFLVLWAVDSLMFAFAVESTLTNGVGGMVLFASEVSLFRFWARAYGFYVEQNISAEAL